MNLNAEGFEIPFWVLAHVVGSKPEDWLLYEDGWINRNEAMRTANPDIGAVYVSQDGAVILHPRRRWPSE
jgi:hypothetical protein